MMPRQRREPNIPTALAVSVLTICAALASRADGAPGCLLVAETAGNAMRLLDPDNAVVAATISLEQAPSDVAIDPQGALAYVTSPAADRVTIVEKGGQSLSAPQIPLQIRTVERECPPFSTGCWPSEEGMGGGLP
jgi:hypothetical protein